jgi:hypothetical protein
MITGTFLDEIGLDIPSANWGHDEWKRDFAAMKADGIDTVVLMRGGHRDRATFESAVLRKRHAHLIVQEDLLGLFLALAEQNGISLWLGTYDPGELAGDPRKQLDLQRAFADEAWERYGRSRAFRGWHVSTAVDAENEGSLDACAALTKHVRQLAGLPVLVAPRLPRAKNGVAGDHGEVFARLRDLADIVVIEDGLASFAELRDHFARNVERAHAHGLKCWTDVVTLDRDAHDTPIAWPKLRFKMEAAVAARADKIITFEYSHFLSPNSMFNSAHTLHKRYREWLATQK